MNMKALWPAVTIASVSLVCVTILLALRVDTTAIVAVISVVAVPIIGAVLYAKVETISQQTNGTTSRQMALLESLTDHLKTHNTVPIPMLPTDTPTDTPTSDITP